MASIWNIDRLHAIWSGYIMLFRQYTNTCYHAHASGFCFTGALSLCNQMKIHILIVKLLFKSHLLHVWLNHFRSSLCMYDRCWFMFNPRVATNRSKYLIQWNVIKEGASIARCASFFSSENFILINIYY